MRKNTVILATLYFAYVGVYIARLNLSMASPELLAQGVLTSVELGFLGSAFSLIYSCGRLFNGILADRLAPKLLIAGGLMLTGLSNLLLGLLPAYLLFLVLWSFNAFGQSMLWSSILRTTTNLYSKVEADKKVTILTTSIAVGNILGILLVGQTVSWMGLRWAFLVPGILTALTGMAVLYVMGTVRIEPPAQKREFALWSLLKDRRLLGILPPALLHGMIKDNISLWMAVYFLDRFAVDLQKTAWYVLLIPAVGLLGRMAYPVLYRLTGKRENLVSLICFGCCAVLSALLLPVSVTPLWAAVCLSLLFAFVSMINTSILSIFPLRFAASNQVASVSGLTDFATYLGSAIGSAVYGFWIAGGHYQYMFLSWTGVSLVSILMLLAQKPMRKEENYV